MQSLYRCQAESSKLIMASSIVIHKPRQQLFSHFFKPCSSTAHLSTLIVILLNLFNGKSKLFGNISNTLVENMDISDGHKSLRGQLRWLCRGCILQMRPRFSIRSVQYVSFRIVFFHSAGITLASSSSSHSLHRLRRLVSVCPTLAVGSCQLSQPIRLFPHPFLPLQDSSLMRVDRGGYCKA